MSEIIKVKEISKAYRIGVKDQAHDNLVSAVTAWLKSPFRNFRKLRSLSRIQESESSSDIIWALKDVSFEVNSGEVLGIIGKNGAGKSTLLKIIAGITEPTGGRIEIYGRIASLLEVGTGFNPELTGRENVYLNGTILGMTKKEIDSKFDEIIDFSGVEKFVDTPIKRYSSGMKVRLAFAVAAFLEPEILIVDEVLAVGDAEFQKKCIGKMEDISSRDGRTVLFVSHNMAAVKSLCNSILVLKENKGIYFDDPVEGIHSYLSSFKDEVDIVSYKGLKFGDLLINNDRNFDFSFTEPIKIQTSLYSQFDILNYRLFCIISNSDNENIVCKEISSDNYPIIKKAGKYSVEVTLPSLWLKPGLYNIFFKILPVGVKLPQRVLSEKVLVNCINIAHGHNFISLLEPKSDWSIFELS